VWNRWPTYRWRILSHRRRFLWRLNVRGWLWSARLSDKRACLWLYPFQNQGEDWREQHMIDPHFEQHDEGVVGMSVEYVE
jgi:hypothetical protein